MKVGPMVYADLMAQLTRGAYTLHELHERTGLHYVTVCEYVRALHKRRVVVIAGWKGDGPRRAAQYRLATGAGQRDAPKPEPIPHIERARHYRARKARAQGAAQAAMTAIARTLA